MDDRDFCDKYLKILETDLSGLNLTRITDPEEFYQKQYLDSILPFKDSVYFKNIIDNTKTHLDVGFGGGFPLLPLKLEFPHLIQLGFESKRKKSDAVNLISKKLGIQNTNTLHKRFEEVLVDVPCMITFKAVSRVNDCLRLINIDKEVSERVTVVIYKAENVFDLEGSDLSLDKDWIKEETFKYKIEGGTRYLFSFKNVPRGTKKHTKNLVNLSTLL